MKMFLSLVAGIALVSFSGFATPAFAHCGSCGATDEVKHEAKSTADKATCTADKSACTADKSACPASEAMKTANKSACASECSKSGCSAAEEVDMVKGGASDSEKAVGYKLGNTVPEFTLPDTTGKDHSLSSFDDKIKMVVFYNQQCPYVVEVKDRLNAFTEKYQEKGVVVLAVDAGTNNSTESVAKHAEDLAYPVLLNKDSNLARKFEATRTPEVYLLDKNNKVVYTGMFDSGKVAEGETRKTPAKDAVDALLNGEDVVVEKTKAFGCTIKFNKETAPKGAPAS